jgi:hypothetical protein
MKYLYAVFGVSFLASCAGFWDALGQSVAETPNAGQVAGDAVGAAVDSAVSGGGPLGAIFAGGSVLATTLAGIVLRTMQKMRKEPSRAASQVAALEARIDQMDRRKQ